jgi:thiol-disulfide isomerase/thioredoxin
MKPFIALLVAVAAAAASDKTAPDRHPGVQMDSQAVRPSSDEMLFALSDATTWINSRPITAHQLRGKVVLIDFWTYTCINWRRTAPHLRSWVDRYGGSDLVLIGVHSPEFAFERELENVREAVQEIGVRYPVAVDNDFTIWQAFRNQYWPALYLFDAHGRLRHQQFGEGGYERTEEVIRQLLEEAGQQSLDARPARLDARGAEAPADWKNLESSEEYVGASRALNFASPGGIVSGKPRRYVVPTSLTTNQWALSGVWTIAGDRAVVADPGGRIVHRFHARDLHLVMGPQTRGNPIRFRVSIDGKPPGEARGTDVDQDGYGTLRQQRMYHLLRQTAPIRDRVFEVEFLDPGAAAFCFTFG